MKLRNSKGIRLIIKYMDIPIVTMIAVCLFLLIQTISEMLEIWAIQDILDGISNGLQGINRGLNLAVCATVIEVLMIAFVDLLTGWMVAKGLLLLRKKLSDKLSKCSFLSIITLGTGEILSRTQEDLDRSAQFSKQMLGNIIYGSILLLVSITLSFWLNWKMAVICILLVPIVLLISTVASKRMEKTAKITREESGRQSQLIQECIWQIPTTKAYVSEKQWERRLNESMDILLSKKQEQSKTIALYEPIISVMRFLPQSIILFYGGYLLLNKEISIGNLMLFTILFGYISNGLASIPQWIAYYRNTSASSERVQELFNLEENKGEDVIAIDDKYQIDFEGVCFAYENDKFQIKDINLKILNNMNVAIVGESGSGKSTLLKLICGIYRPMKGHALVYGFDLQKCRPEKIYEKTSIILQDTFLFPGTIYENLTMGEVGLTKSEVIEACKKSYIYDWIQTLPNGLDTKISEFASNISGGQKQRIGLARAILKSTNLWLLDEPTSSLDFETSQKFIYELNEIAKDCTTILVTHQIPLVTDYDLIVYMENGQIADIGTHNYLFSQNDNYRTMFENQLISN